MDMNEIKPAGAAAVRAALGKRSAKALMSALDGMDGETMTSALTDAGFSVSEAARTAGRQAIFSSVKADLQQALRLGVDGKGMPIQQLDVQTPQPAQRDAAADALAVVRDVFAAAGVRIMPLGQDALADRASLQMVAAQGLEKGVMGFGIEGVPGKFELPATLGELVDLHGAATRSVAEASTRSALVAWSTGSTVRDMSAWVPDSVQRLLQGGVSVDSTQRVLSSLSDGLVGRHAEGIGRGLANALLAEKGLDASAPSVEEQAEGLGLQVVDPDRHRAQFFGTVVAQDHRASLIKVSRDSALVLSVREMGGQRHPIGASVRVGFKAGELSVTSKSAERGIAGR